MTLVETQRFTTPDFRLESGVKLPELTLAYETYGRLAPDGRNAVLVTHGFTSSHHAAGVYAPSDPQPGWWDTLIGPGKAIDTDRWFVVSSNMLGSSYGSTAPRSTNPATGRPYGPGFPDIMLRDIVGAQRALLDALGIRRLVAVAGPSFGGYQAFQWAVTYPDFMLGVVPVVTAPKGSGGPQAVDSLVRRFAADPAWNGGWHYDKGGIPRAMLALRLETLRHYGTPEVLARTIADPAERERRLHEQAEQWAREFDPNSMIALRKAAVGFDAERDLRKIRAKVLYVLSRTDRLFPPSLAPGVVSALARAGVDARYVELDTDLGHVASGPEWAQWAPALRAFLEELERSSATR
ncbi:MAG TPA: alpha/beta fold hydrolase [Candidatus Tectomicrobia bacterium]|nr:alpha/beta fold hydrolase [Candidatus Tectomicrobia bacterium]